LYVDEGRRIAKVTGASFISSLVNLGGEESFDTPMLGVAEKRLAIMDTF